ncbi:hypothetical protein WJX82_007147 [Trebouxia sp. C0006]
MVPATDPADAVTAPLVGYESSSGDEGPLVGDQPFARYKDSARGSRTESEPGLSICSDDDATGGKEHSSTSHKTPSLAGVYSAGKARTCGLRGQ